MDIDAPDCLPYEILRETAALRLFLEDGRFPDNRRAAEVKTKPISAGNCHSSALLLTSVLDAYDPDGEWFTVAGWCTGERHVFTLGKVEGNWFVADLTADQFGLAEVVFRRFGQDGEDDPAFQIKCFFKASGWWEPEDFDDCRLLLADWKEAAETYRSHAEEVLDARRQSPHPR